MYVGTIYISLFTGTKKFEQLYVTLSSSVSNTDKSFFIMVHVYFGKRFKIYCHVDILCAQL